MRVRHVHDCMCEQGWIEQGWNGQGRQSRGRQNLDVFASVQVVGCGVFKYNSSETPTPYL